MAQGQRTKLSNERSRIERYGNEEILPRATTDALLANTERKLEGGDQEEEKPLTPDACVTCGEGLESHWQCCPVCGTRYGLN